MKLKQIGTLTCGLVLALALPAGAATPLNAVILDDDPAGNNGDARVKVLHASPDAPAVDVVVNDAIAFSNIAFEEATDFA
jgi:hypothetical protein